MEDTCSKPTAHRTVPASEHTLAPRGVDTPRHRGTPKVPGLLSALVALTFSYAVPVHATAILDSPADFATGVEAIALDDLVESIVEIPTPNSVRPVPRARYSNDQFEVRSLDEPVPGSPVHGTLGRVTRPGGETTLESSRVFRGFPPFARLGMEFLFTTPVVEFGFTSVTAGGLQPRTLSFFDIDDLLIDVVDITGTSNSRQERFGGLSSPDRPISRLVFEEDNGTVAMADGVGTPVIVGPLFLTPLNDAPTPLASPASGLLALLGFASLALSTAGRDAKRLARAG